MQSSYAQLLEYRLYEQAAIILAQEAALGDARAMSLLGLLYATGTGVEHNPDMAEQLMWSAAARGDVHGQTSLGIWLVTRPSPSASRLHQGLAWLEVASEQGSTHAWIAAQGYLSKRPQYKCQRLTCNTLAVAATSRMQPKHTH